jgi:hypothetical protein
MIPPDSSFEDTPYVAHFDDDEVDHPRTTEKGNPQKEKTFENEKMCLHRYYVV